MAGEVGKEKNTSAVAINEGGHTLQASGYWI